MLSTNLLGFQSLLISLVTQKQISPDIVYNKLNWRKNPQADFYFSSPLNTFNLYL